MKKLFLTTLVLATSVTAFASVVEQVKDGTANFTGKLVANTCEVNANSQNLTVQLPTLQTRLLAAANNTAGLTLFQIQLDKCGEETKARAYFLPTPDKVDLTSGRLKNTASSGATNVQVQLLDSDTTTVIDVIKNSGSQGKLQTINDSNNKLNYYAKYYATGKTTAGAVTASVDYHIDYE